MSDAVPTIQAITIDFLKQHNLKQIDLLRLLADALHRHGKRGVPTVSAISNYVQGIRSIDYWWCYAVYTDSTDERVKEWAKTCLRILNPEAWG